jgi:hypothetical protein
LHLSVPLSATDTLGLETRLQTSNQLRNDATSPDKCSGATPRDTLPLQAKD